MKKITKVLTLLSLVLAFAVTTSKAQDIVVKLRPNHEAGRRPERPSHDHVWVADEWTPNGGSYVVKEGHWEVPPHHGAVWVAGHWRNHPHGYVWVPGHWR